MIVIITGIIDELGHCFDFILYIASRCLPYILKTIIKQIKMYPEFNKIYDISAHNFVVTYLPISKL